MRVLEDWCLANEDGVVIAELNLELVALYEALSVDEHLVALALSQGLSLLSLLLDQLLLCFLALLLFNGVR